MAMNLAPPRKSLQLHSLEKGKIDVLSLLHHLHTAPITQRDVLVRALHDLSPSEIDSILPQLIHLWTQWEDSAALGLRDFFLAQCATSQYFTLRIMFNLQAEEAHAAAGSQTIPRIRSLLKLSEMAHVNAELPKEAQSKHHSQPQQQPTSTAAARRSSAAELPSRASTSQQLPQVDPNRRMSAAMPNRSASTGSVLSKSQSVQQPTPLSQSVRSSTQPLLSTNVPSPSSINLPGRNGGAMMPVALNRYVKLVQVSIVPATISAPINAVVSVLIKPTVLASPSNPASTVVHASSPALVRGSSPSPQQQHQQQLQQQRQQPNIMLGGSDPRRNSNAHQRPDGPSVAFTSDNSWRPSPSASPNRSPAPPRHSPQNMRNSPTPHTVLAANDNFSLNSFPVPPGGHNHPTSPQPLSSSSSTSPPVIQVIRRSASEKATPTPPPPALTRNLSNEEVETLNEFFAAHAPSASPTTIATTISPTAVNKDAEDLDVDWPANDDNLPTGTPSTAPTTSSSKNNNTLAKPTPSSGSTSVSPAPIPLPYRSASSGVHLHSANPSDTSKLGVEESVLFHLLSKQVRSEYFNLQLLFFSALHDLSVLLTHVALADRNRVLREQLTAIDTSICRGLYFPIVPYSSVESQTHYRILRLLPDECWSLASRDKAPFLLHMEIAYAEAPKSAFAGEVTRAMSTYDSDIYTIFKSNEQIMADALSAAAASSSFSPATQPAGDKLSANLSPPIMSGATNSPGDAPAIARETAAHIAQMKDATPTPVASSTVTSPAVSHSDNLHSNPAANIQANGLNIVADGLDESTAATNSSTPSGSKTLTRKHSSAETVMDVDGKPITRSRSSSQLQLSRQSSSNSNVADEESDIVQELVTTAPSKHGAEASTTPTKPTHGYSYSVSVPSSPRQSKGNLGVDEIATETKNLRLDASTPTAAPPQPAASAPAHASAAKSTTTAATTPAAAASSAASAAASTTPSASAKPAPLKGTRFVPSANPHRPRRSSTYQSGPSLCDVDFPLLNAAYGESFQAKKNRVYSLSPFKSTCQPPTWDLISVIFKGGDDLRQEVLAMQFINAFDRIFKASNLPIYLRPYAVMITSADSGLIETIPNAVSVDSLKKRLFPSWTCLTDFYAAYFRGIEIQSIILGPEEFLKKYPCEFGIVNYSTALRNFVESMAGYSIVCYLLQVKDRHNGNIMIDRAGHVVHIDWGFLLSNSPGGNWNFEQAPFKLTQEYLDVMGGVHSDLFAYFKMLVTRGFLEARAHVDEFVALGSIHARTSKMPCFMGPISYASPNGVIDAMRARFAMHLKSESEVEKFVEGLIESSIDNWRTVRYDSYQKLVSGIL